MFKIIKELEETFFPCLLSCWGQVEWDFEGVVQWEASLLMAGGLELDDL